MTNINKLREQLQVKLTRQQKAVDETTAQLLEIDKLISWQKSGPPATAPKGK